MRRRLRKFVRGSRGTSYTLPFVMLVPFYLTFLVTAFEVCILLLAAIGVQYAAFQGCRSAVVWVSATPTDLRDDRIRFAVFKALAPYVGGRERDGTGDGNEPPGLDDQAREFAQAIIAAAPAGVATDPGSGRYFRRGVEVPTEEQLIRKFRTAGTRTRIELTADATRHDGDLALTVRYRAPLHFPLVSRFLDADGVAPFEYEIVATVTLPNDAPKNRRHTPDDTADPVIVDLDSDDEIPTVGPNRGPHPLGIEYSSVNRR